MRKCMCCKARHLQQNGLSFCGYNAMKSALISIERHDQITVHQRSCDNAKSMLSELRYDAKQVREGTCSGVGCASVATSAMVRPHSL